MQKERYAYVKYKSTSREYTYRCSEKISAGNIVAAPTDRGRRYSIAIVTRVKYLSEDELPIEPERILYIDRPLSERDESLLFDNPAFLRTCVKKYPPKDWICLRSAKGWLTYANSAIACSVTYEYDDGTLFCDYGDCNEEGSICAYTITSSEDIELKIKYIESLMQLLYCGKISPAQFEILIEHVNGPGYTLSKPPLQHCEPTPVLGLKRGKVALLPHCAEWSAMAAGIICALKDYFYEFAVDIQHVGSTAIESVCAKPVVDIAVGVQNMSYILHYLDGLYRIGAHFRGSDIPGQLLFVTGDMDGEIITAYIHVLEYGGEAWNNYINFRDYLNAFPDRAKNYDALKRQLMALYGEDRAAYTNAKQPLISKILAAARAWRNESV